MSFAIQPGQTVVFFGDSITDAGRTSGAGPLGTGYVQQIVDLVQARYPGHQNTFINAGIGGNHVKQLADRLTDDVIARKPDWVSILIGINDTYRHFLKLNDPTLTPEEYDSFYTRVLTRLSQETSAQLVIIEPFLISNDRDPGSQRTQIRELLETSFLPTARKLAEKFDARLIRAHDLFADQLKHRAAATLSGDAVHLTPAGVAVLTSAWLRELGW